MDRLSWLRERQKGIGASDAPVVLGLGFESAGWLYRQKVGPVAGCEPESGPLARGTRLEPVVAELYERRMGASLVAPLPMARHPERPWQFANVDRLRIDDQGEGQDVELKTTAGFGDAWGDPGTDQVPDKYRVQCQHTMGVRGRESMDLAALDVVAWELRVYRLAFDPAFFAWLTEVEYRFLRDHVHALRPPGPDWEAQFRGEAEARLVVPGKRAELGPDAAELVRRREQFRDLARDAEAEAAEITRRLEELLGDAEEASAGPWRLKWQTRRAHTRPACDVKESRSLSLRLVKEKT